MIEKIKRIIFLILNGFSLLIGICMIFVGIIGDFTITGKIGAILIGIPFISPLRKIVKEKMSFKIRTIVYVSLFIIGTVLLSNDPSATTPIYTEVVDNSQVDDMNNDDKETDNSTNNETTVKNDDKKSKEVTIDEIFTNKNKYTNKTVTVIAFAPWEGFFNPETGEVINIIYSEDWSKEIVVDNIKDVISGGYQVKVTGKIYEKDSTLHIDAKDYVIDESVERDDYSDDSNSINKSDFAKMKEASINYSSLNWNQLSLNPTSLAGTYVYIPGKVIDVDVSNGSTTGLIDTQGYGNIQDLVSFIIYSEIYDIKVGDIIAPTGTIASIEGSAYNSATDQTVKTPLIQVNDTNLYKTEYYLDLSDKEIQDFMYGTYIASDSDADTNLGKSFKFTDSKIGNHTYKYQDKVYLNPSIRITSGTLMRGYDNIRIGMDIIAEGIGTKTSVDSNIRVTTFSIYLKDGSALVDSDGYRHNYYKK